MKKENILSEISRTAAANAGNPLGVDRFESETGIKRSDWFGIHWTKWGDAIREAGLTPNEMNAAFDDELLLRKYAELARELGKLPTAGDLRMKRRADSGFPSWNTFSRFGLKLGLIRKVMESCLTQQGFEGVVKQCEEHLRFAEKSSVDGGDHSKAPTIGYVYLIKHGSRREYKIGFTNNRIRREGEIRIELPEKVEPIHVIETDDPAGVEAYWHNRFREKRLEGEWFSLTVDDVQSFKRWRRIS